MAKFTICMSSVVDHGDEFPDYRYTAKAFIEYICVD